MRNSDDRSRPIRADERSGVLHPGNLERYRARWFEPDPSVAAVVQTYWAVSWHLQQCESVSQVIIAAPAVTLTIEEGNVPAPLVVTGVHSRAWRRDIAGSGTVFGVQLRPAGLAVLSDLVADDVADGTVAVTRELDDRLYGALAEIADHPTVNERVHAADRVVARRLEQRPVTEEGQLANSIVDGLTEQLQSATGAALAARFGVSERSIQRALRRTIGHGPKWVSRWVRLQEVARALSVDPSTNVAALAGRLGYTDQSHLINDFRGAVGATPGAYVRSLRVLTEPD